MANLSDKQLLLPLKLRVVRVEGNRPSDPLDGPSSVAEFERVWPLLEGAVELGGEHDKWTVLAALEKGERQLWVGERSAVVTEMFTHPTGLRVMSIWLAGGELKEFLPWLPAVEAWGRARGAEQLRLSGRRGWAKLTGYRELRVLMVKDV